METSGSVFRLRIIPFLKKWNIVNLFFGAIDIVAITMAFQLSYFINNLPSGGMFYMDNKLLLLFLAVLPFWLLVLYMIKITEIPRTKRYSVLFIEYFQSAFAVSITLLVIYFIFSLSWIPLLFLAGFTFLGFIFLFFVRFVEYKVFKSFRAKGYNYANVVLIADESSIPTIENLLVHKEWGYRIIAIFTESVQLKDKYKQAKILLPGEYLNVLNDLMEVDIIDEVLHIKGKIIASEVRESVRSCEELGVVFSLRYTDSNKKLTNAIKTVIGREKFLTFINIPHNTFTLAVKHIMDINISLFMIITLSPVLVGITLLIKFTSPGPVLFMQRRVGLRGRYFDLYKFRTMVINAEKLREKLEAENEADGPVFKIKDDPRVTKIGNFLRKTGLDELPQLFNILKGEMSLIGPRPPIPEETRQYKRWQLRRLSVKPGLSCFWQIKPDRNNIKFEKWMELDLAYIDNWSLRLDFLILIKTINTVFHRTGL
jgi:exopolysaccharide biosynthesis polyprenyl glycosylphosphotransferase